MNTFLNLLDVRHTESYSGHLFNEHPHKYNLFGLSKNVIGLRRKKRSHSDTRQGKNMKDNGQDIKRPDYYSIWDDIKFGLPLHYIKIAVRNMRKYKTQTLLNVVSLALGLTCFALSMLWIRYEMSYDGSLTNANQLYVVYRHDNNRTDLLKKSSSIPLAAYLKETFSEIVNAAPVISSPLFLAGR